MSDDPISPHLTEPNPDLARRRAMTVPGMAHWGGTGPERTFCGGCVFHGFEYLTASGKARKSESSCEKYKKLTGTIGDSLDKKQPSCRHYEARQK